MLLVLQDVPSWDVNVIGDGGLIPSLKEGRGFVHLSLDFSSKCYKIIHMLIQLKSLKHNIFNCNGQGESELFNGNEKFNGTSGFQELRSGCIEHMEYNFLTAQTSSNSQDSKVSSYDSQMALGFDSSHWFEKEALPLLPKVAGRNQVTSYCSWCGNEFHSEGFDSEADKGLVVHVCPNCRTRSSTNHNFF